MYERTCGADGEIVARFTGTFDVATARSVRLLLRDIPLDARVVLDFTRAHDVDYCGLAALADEISHTYARLRLRGLCRNHVRMLRYFGFDPAAFSLSEDAPVGA